MGAGKVDPRYRRPRRDGQLPEDLAGLDNLISLVLVADPFGNWDSERLAAGFNRGAVPFKQHHVVELGPPVDVLAGAHHRRNALTKNDELAEKARLMRNFGFVNYDKVSHVGTNGKMNEMSAAMGLSSLEDMDTFIAADRANYLAYREGLADVPGLRVLTHNDAERCNFQYVVIDVDEHEARLDRDQLVRLLIAEGVLARRYFHPGCHRMEPYRSYFPHAGLLLAVTERQSARVFSLPTGTSVGAGQIATICRLLALAIVHGEELSGRLEPKADAAGPVGLYRLRVA